MIKSTDVINQQLNQLIEKHPNLEGITIRSASQMNDNDFSFLADFIDHSWKSTYGEQERFDYNQDYLKWVFENKGFESPLSAVSKSGNELCGLIFFTKRRLLLNGVEVESGIQTALSIKTSHKGKGLAQFQILNLQKMAIGMIPLLFYWWDQSVKTKRSSYKIFNTLDKNYLDFWGRFPLKTKILNYRRAVKNAHLNPVEKMGLRIMMTMEGHGRKRTVERIDSSNTEEVTTFINQSVKTKGYGRLFTNSELFDYACFDGKATNFSSLGVLLRHSNGKVAGVAVGYNLNVIGKSIDNALFLDCIIVENKHDLSSMFLAIESVALEKLNPFAILTLHPSAGLMQGFAPVGKFLICNSINFKEGFRKPQKQTMFLDHK